MYDIADDKIRRKAIKICKNVGLYRVQKSIFLGDIEENDFEVLFTISGGSLSLHSSENIEHSKVMKLTDFALNEAKKRGRNRCYTFAEKDYALFLRKRDCAGTERIHKNGLSGVCSVLSAGI